MNDTKTHVTDEQIVKVTTAVVAFIERASKENASPEEVQVLPRMVNEFVNIWLGESMRV